MGSLGEVAKTSARGSINLLVGSVVSMILSVSGSILVAQMLSSSEYGLFTISLTLPGLFLLFSDWGVDIALIRFIARFRSEGKLESIWDLLTVSFVFKLAVGGLLSAFLFLFADGLTATVLQRPEVGDLVKITSLLVLSQSMYFSFLSVLSGLERMGQKAIVDVCQSAVQGICSPLLVFFGLGVTGAAIGYVLSFIVAALIGFLLILSSSSQMKPSEKTSPTITRIGNMRMIMSFGLPLFLGALVTGFAHRFRNVVLSWFVSDETIGNYAVAFRLFNIIQLVAGSIGATHYPAFSKFSYAEEPNKTREVFQGLVRYASIVLLPFAFLSMTVSTLVINLFFVDKYPQAPLFVNLLLISTLLVASGSISIRSFLNSQGKTKTTTVVNLVGSLTFIVLASVLVRTWGVEGLILSIIISSFASDVLGLLMAHRLFGVSPNFWHAGRVLLCSLTSAGISQGVLSLLSVGYPLIGLLISTGVFISVFLVLAPITGAIKTRDLKTLDAVLQGLGKLYPFISPLLIFESKILEWIA